jgi:hypothetical protein
MNPLIIVLTIAHDQRNTRKGTRFRAIIRQSPTFIRRPALRKIENAFYRRATGWIVVVAGRTRAQCPAGRFRLGLRAGEGKGDRLLFHIAILLSAVIVPPHGKHPARATGWICLSCDQSRERPQTSGYQAFLSILALAKTRHPHKTLCLLFDTESLPLRG